VEAAVRKYDPNRTAFTRLVNYGRTDEGKGHRRVHHRARSASPWRQGDRFEKTDVNRATMDSARCQCRHDRPQVEMKPGKVARSHVRTAPMCSRRLDRVMVIVRLNSGEQALHPWQLHGRPSARFPDPDNLIPHRAGRAATAEGDDKMVPLSLPPASPITRSVTAHRRRRSPPLGCRHPVHSWGKPPRVPRHSSQHRRQMIDPVASRAKK